MGTWNSRRLFKKFRALLFLLAFLFSISGCGGISCGSTSWGGGDEWYKRKVFDDERDRELDRQKVPANWRL